MQPADVAMFAYKVNLVKRCCKMKAWREKFLGSVDRMPRQSLPSIPLWKEMEKSF